MSRLGHEMHPVVLDLDGILAWCISPLSSRLNRVFQIKLPFRVPCLWLQRCSVDVYVEGLLRPCVESGELGRLTDQMLLIDASLEKWNPYLTASCRFFLKNKLHHVLYEFQIFMKVVFTRRNVWSFPRFFLFRDKVCIMQIN